MKVTKFDRPTCKALRDVMQKALTDAGIEGIEFEVGNMSFNANEVSIKVKGVLPGAADDRIKKAAMMAEIHGLASTEKDGWKLVDFHSKKPKYPFIAENANGTQYKLSPEQARNRFGSAEVAA